MVAFSDANGRWELPTRAAPARFVISPTPTSPTSAGRVRLEHADGTNREGAYWRFELWLRGNESMLGSITAGNGGIYAVRRSDYIENGPKIGHDLGLPYQLAQRGRRAVYDPDAVAWEKLRRVTRRTSTAARCA